MNPHIRETHRTLSSEQVGPMSRRTVVGVAGMGILELLCGSALGQDDANVQAERAERQRRIRELISQSSEAAEKENFAKMSPQERAFWNGIENAGSMEERQKVLQDYHTQQMLGIVNNELGASPDEWAVIQPRLLAVLRLQQAPYGVGDTPAAILVAQLIAELKALVANKETKPEEIKAKLTALRSAKEQARRELTKAQRSLRQLMSLRQEAVLVLNGLLD